MVTDNFFFFFFSNFQINYTEYNLSITIKRNNEAVAVLASSKCGGGWHLLLPACRKEDNSHLPPFPLSMGQWPQGAG